MESLFFSFFNLVLEKNRKHELISMYLIFFLTFDYSHQCIKEKRESEVRPVYNEVFNGHPEREHSMDTSKRK